MRAHLNSYFNRGFIDHPSFEMLFRHLFHVGVGKWVPTLSKVYGSQFKKCNEESIIRATFEGASYSDFENRWEELCIDDAPWHQGTNQIVLRQFGSRMISQIKKSSYYLGLLNEFDPDGENRKYLLNYYKDEWKRRHTVHLKW